MAVAAPELGDSIPRAEPAYERAYVLLVVEAAVQFAEWNHDVLSVCGPFL
jgi:hypothetical protein